MKFRQPGVVLFVVAFGGLFSIAADAGQLRSVTAGVYSAGQAARGEQIYRAQCGDCHGRAMEGAIGPPLVGESFLANWSARPLADVVDKIQKTMPFEQPGSLSRQQSADLVAYMLQAGKFPAGPAELGESALAQIVMPTVSAASACRRIGRRAASRARRQPGRADASGRVSEREHHLQPAAQESGGPAHQAAGFLAV